MDTTTTDTTAESRTGIGPPSILPIAREGLVSGVIGAAAVAIWFLAVDAIAGEPFRTPALLGAGMFQGVTAEELAGMPEGAATLVAAYTLVHGVAFVVAGLIIASAVSMFERSPVTMIPGLFFLVVFFEFAYYMYALAFVQPVLAAVSWTEVLIGNLVAVASMGIFFWRRHPDLLRRLAGA